MTEEWNESETGYPEPTVITVDENTDFSKIHEQALPAESPKVRRSLVGMMVFHTPEDFEAWQRQAPREIFEVTPKFCVTDRLDKFVRIFVTYNAGIIE